jgi:dephospho-CoA kinase
MIIGVTGTVAAGKETLTSYFREKGFIYFETREIIKEELTKLGLEHSRTNMQDWADKLRQENGPGALMQVMLDRTEPGKNYMFDSLRNHLEAEFLKSKLGDEFLLLAVDAPAEIRFQRMVSRGKESDPRTWEEFVRMNERDLDDKSNPHGQHVGKLLEMADFVITNDSDIEKAEKQVEKVAEILDLLKRYPVAIGKKFKHYKGHEYEIIGKCFHSEDLQMLILYKLNGNNEFGNKPVWARPIEKFFEKILVDGKEIVRFEEII